MSTTSKPLTTASASTTSAGTSPASSSTVSTVSAAAVDLGSVALLPPGSEGSEASGAAVASALGGLAGASALLGAGVQAYRTLRRRSRARRAVDPQALEEGRLEGIVPGEPDAPKRCEPSAPKGCSPEVSPQGAEGASRRVCFLPGAALGIGASVAVDSTAPPSSAPQGSGSITLSSLTLSSLSRFGLSPRRRLSGLSPASNGFVGSSRPLCIYSVTPDEFMT
jgi:hypothetical protein